MDQHGLNASSFAERIHVGRSSISHIISGRNKPSLDFVINTVKEFPEVDLYWLLNGKGTYPKSQEKNISTPSTDLPNRSKVQSTTTNEAEVKKSEASHDLFSTMETRSTVVNTKQNNGKNIQKVILLYDDGSFEYFIP